MTPFLRSGVWGDLNSSALQVALGYAAELFLAEHRHNGFPTLPDEVHDAMRSLVALGRAARPPACDRPVAAEPEMFTTPAGNGPTMSTMSSSEAATMLGLESDRRVRQMATSGELQGERDRAGRWRFAAAEVQALAAKRATS